MNFLSLFSGIGGFESALERAGFQCVGSVELDAFCRSVLALRFPGVRQWRDVRRFKATQLRRALEQQRWPGRERLDLLVGGFPCQDLSVAGHRDGLRGRRSGLFWEIVRIAQIARPTWGLFENVPGLLSSNSGRDMWTVLEGLRECWPHVGYRILDSRYFGVAQRRRRVFLVGGPTEAGVAQVLALFDGRDGDPQARGETGPGVAREIKVGVDLARALGGIGGGQDYGANKGTLVADPVSASEGKTYTHEGTHNLRLHNVVSEDPEIVRQAMSAKWAKRSSGPAGDEHHNLIVASTLSGGSNPNSNIAGRHREDDDNLVMTFKPSHFTRGKDGEPSELSPPLSADADKGDQDPLVFESRHFTRDQGGPPTDIVPALKTHKTGGQGDAEPLVFEARVARNGRGAPDELVPPLKAESGQTGKGDGAPLVFTERTRADGRNLETQDDLAYSINNPGDGGRTQENRVAVFRKAQKAHDPDDCERWEEDDEIDTLAHGTVAAAAVVTSAVRRLTPVECEKLQAFPPGWTCRCQPLEAYAIDEDGTALRCTCADSPRYRALGNAVTTSVVFWIAQRLRDVRG